MFDSSASRMLQSVQSSAQPATQQWLQPPSDSAVPQQQPQQTDDAQVQPQQQPALISDEQKLDTFEAVLSEMDEEKQQTASPPQSDPAPIEPLAETAPPQPVAFTPGLAKEQAPVVQSAELPGGMQYAESEPKPPEIPAEVESYLQKVEEQTINLPNEIVIAAEQHAASQPRNLPQDVKVLPITQAQLEVGKKKNPSFSIKWLVTFSEKLTDMFKGKAVYRSE